jgi:hypothetical protein
MTEKRFELTMSGNEVAQYEIIDHSQEILTVYNNLGNVYFSSAMKICELLNSLADENEQLKQQRIDLLRLIENNIEIYENINTNVEFHKGEIQGKLTLLNNLREVILND